MGCKQLFLREDLQVFSSLLIVGYHAVGGIFGEMFLGLSYPFLMWFPSHLPSVKGLLHQV